MSKFILNNCQAKADIITDVMDDGLNTIRKEVRCTVTMEFVGCGDFSWFEQLTELERNLYVGSKLFTHNKEIEL